LPFTYGVTNINLTSKGSQKVQASVNLNCIRCIIICPESRTRLICRASTFMHWTARTSHLSALAYILSQSSAQHGARQCGKGHTLFQGRLRTLNSCKCEICEPIGATFSWSRVGAVALYTLLWTVPCQNMGSQNLDSWILDSQNLDGQILDSWNLDSQCREPTMVEIP
jgi:hypothetical protein